MEEKNCPECGNEIYKPYRYCNACGWEKKEEDEEKPATKKEAKKKSTEEKGKELEEPVKITCKCGTKFKIKSTKRPLKIQCPKCGKTGVLKGPEKPAEPSKKTEQYESELKKPEGRSSRFKEKSKKRGTPKHLREDREHRKRSDRLRDREARLGPDECPKCGSRLGITGTCPNCGYRSKSRARAGAGFDKRERKRSKQKPPKGAHVVKPRKGICSSCGSKDLRFFDDGTGSCPNCGHEFTWDPHGPRIQQEEYYCERCRGPLEFIEEYERWYCYNCEEYF